MQDHNSIYRLCLLGKNIKSSLSPLIHDSSAHFLGKRCKYDIVELENENDFNNFLQHFWDHNGYGLNITTPFKEFFNSQKEQSKNHLSSINTLVRANQNWKGFSTDGPGFKRGLQQDGYKLEHFSHFIICNRVFQVFKH